MSLDLEVWLLVLFHHVPSQSVWVGESRAARVADHRLGQLLVERDPHRVVVHGRLVDAIGTSVLHMDVKSVVKS